MGFLHSKNSSPFWSNVVPVEQISLIFPFEEFPFRSVASLVYRVCSEEKLTPIIYNTNLCMHACCWLPVNNINTKNQTLNARSEQLVTKKYEVHFIITKLMSNHIITHLTHHYHYWIHTLIIDCALWTTAKSTDFSSAQVSVYLRFTRFICSNSRNREKWELWYQHDIRWNIFC